VHPVLYEIDLFGLLNEPVALHTYGVLIATGFMLAMTLAKRQGEREGEDPDRIVDMAFYVLLWGLIGARAVFILTKFDQFARNPFEIVAFWRGGLVWYGGFIGATLYVYFSTRKHRLNPLKFLDIVMPATALAHSFGRMGCLAAGCCFGLPTDKPWAVTFPDESMAHAAQHNEGLVGYGDATLAIHPTQMYEALGEIGLFWLMISMRPHKRFHGQLFLTWLALYPVLRSTIEFFRGDSERGVWMFGLSTSQYLSILVAGFAAYLFFHLRKQGKVGSEHSPA